jgi:hypothetical protein
MLAILVILAKFAGLLAQNLPAYMPVKADFHLADGNHALIRMAVALSASPKIWSLEYILALMLGLVLSALLAAVGFLIYFSRHPNAL